MLLNYGRGRAEQFRVLPTLGSAPNFVPPLFCLYVALLPLWWWISPWLASLIGWYFLVVVIQLFFVPSATLGLLLRVFPLIVLTHVCYGLGFWKGLFTQLKPPGVPSNVPVIIERIEPD